jgi:hypothetical protein
VRRSRVGFTTFRILILVCWYSENSGQLSAPDYNLPSDIGSRRMDVDGMKDASNMHKLLGPQAGRRREGWLVTVAGSGRGCHQDSRVAIWWPSGYAGLRKRGHLCLLATSDCRLQR